MKIIKEKKHIDISKMLSSNKKIYVYWDFAGAFGRRVHGEGYIERQESFIVYSLPNQSLSRCLMGHITDWYSRGLFTTIRPAKLDLRRT